jgi:hypothetical protein
MADYDRLILRGWFGNGGGGYPPYDQIQGPDQMRPELISMQGSNILRKAIWSDEPWEVTVPLSYFRMYGEYGKIRFIQDIMSEKMRYPRTNNLLSSNIISLLEESGISYKELSPEKPYEEHFPELGRKFDIKLPSHNISTSVEDLYTYALAYAIENHRDSNIESALQGKDQKRSGEIYAKFPSSVWDGLYRVYPQYHKEIEKIRSIGDARGGFGFREKAGTAYVLGYMRQSLDYINPDPNPPRNSDRSSLCKTLVDMEYAIFARKNVDVGDAYDAGQLRRQVGPCE